MVKVKIYALAAFVTLLLIVSSFYLNWYMGNTKEQELQQKYYSIDSLLSSSQLEFEYISSAKDNCNLLNETIGMTRTNLVSINTKLEEYKDYLVSDVEFNRLKTEQTILYVKIWMLSKKVKESCNMNFSTMLYFWDTSMQSKEQGYIVDAVRNDHPDDLIIIPLDYNFDIGIINLLKKDYKIDSAPTILIDENTKLTGLNSKDEIEKFL